MQNNEYMQETVSGVRQLTEDEKIRQQCQAREDYLYWERIREYQHQQALDQIQILSTENQALSAEIQVLSSEILQLRAQMADLMNK